MSDNSYEQEDWGSQGSDNDWDQPGGKDDDEVDSDYETLVGNASKSKFYFSFIANFRGLNP